MRKSFESKHKEVCGDLSRYFMTFMISSFGDSKMVDLKNLILEEAEFYDFLLVDFTKILWNFYVPPKF